MHYWRAQRDGELDRYPLSRRANGAVPPPCAVGGCDLPARAKGLCGTHYGRLRRHGDPEAPARRYPERAPSGSGTLTRQGYRMVYRPGHPNANPRSGQIAEHVLVMAEAVGRPLAKGETVHHRNGVRADNRLENLELWVRSHPSGQRVEDAVAHSLEVLRRYAPAYLTEEAKCQQT
jgi:hypothetical protein